MDPCLYVHVSYLCFLSLASNGSCVIKCFWKSWFFVPKWLSLCGIELIVRVYRRQDFDQVQVPSGSVCICRYGKIYRGDKAREAESHGCLGLLIVSDPADTLAEKEEEAVREGRATPMDVDRYPLSASLPLDGVQRGSVLIPNGDPLTPGWPATSHEQRLPRDAEYVKESLPSIPVRPISASNVLPLMKVMDGPDAPEDW